VRKILALAAKELRQIRRDPLSLVLLLGLPAFMLVVFGYAISFDVEHVQLGVYDQDKTAAARALVEGFLRSHRFDLAATPQRDAEVDRLLEEGRIQLALVIPRGYGERLARGEGSPVQLVLDGTNSSTAATILGYAEGVVADHNAVALARFTQAAGLEAGAGLDIEPRVWFNPELDSTHFLVPGLIAFILMITAVLSTALSLVREKERGTLEQLRVSPLATVEVLVGKMLPYLGIALAATALILLAARGLFGVTVRGPYLDLFLVTLLYLVGGFGFGLLISTLADSQAVAFQMGVFASVLPTLILSGFIFPIRNMPLWLQAITHIVPARYYLVVLRGIIVKGTGLGPFLDQVGWLALYSFLVLALASLRFAREERG
jgi:ABC-2 type transport system permease protein